MSDRVGPLRRVVAALLLGSATVAAAQTVPDSAPVAAPREAKITIRGDTPGPTYDRRIFTQFAEHLGTGIYGGLWVGPKSPIPNTMRWWRRST